MSVVLGLLFLLSGLVGQFEREPVRATEQLGGPDAAFLVNPSSSGPFTTPQALPQASVDAVEEARPFLIGRTVVEGEQVMLVGVESHPDAPVIVEGEAAVGSGQIVLDRTAGYAVGDSIVLGGRRATVTGVTEEATVLAGLPLGFVDLAYAQLVVLSGQEIVTGAVVPAGTEGGPAAKVLTAADVAADTRKPLDPAVDSIDLVRVLLWFVTAVVIGATVYSTATSRTRDFAVLKAVGGRDGFLAGSLFVEAMAVTAIACVLGALLQFVVRPLFPLVISVPSAAWWQIPLGALVIAAVAAMVGVRKVRATSPAEAFG